jgi:hypothetical protein
VSSLGGALRKAGLSVLVLLLAAALAAGGVAAIWFPVEAMVNFRPRNITVGWPGNPRIPDDEQRADLVFDSLLMIAIGVVLVAGAVVLVVERIKHLRRSGWR